MAQSCVAGRGQESGDDSMLNNYASLESVTSLPECVNEAFNITSLSNQYSPLLKNDGLGYKDNSLICQICLKVMEEIDEILTDPAIEDKVSCKYCNDINMVVNQIVISIMTLWLI